jgi:Na+/proline symporter
LYGVAVTPALFAALTWKRATWQGGVASIVGGAVSTVFFELALPRIAPGVLEAAHGLTGAAAAQSNFGADPWGIPSIYPSAIISIGLLVIVSLMTPPPASEVLEKLFPTRTRAGR